MATINYHCRACLFREPIFKDILWIAISEKATQVMDALTEPIDISTFTSEQKLAKDRRNLLPDQSSNELTYPMVMLSSIADTLFTNFTNLEDLVSELENGDHDATIKAAISTHWPLMAELYVQELAELEASQ